MALSSSPSRPGTCRCPWISPRVSSPMATAAGTSSRRWSTPRRIMQGHPLYPIRIEAWGYLCRKSRIPLVRSAGIKPPPAATLVRSQARARACSRGMRCAELSCWLVCSRRATRARRGSQRVRSNPQCQVTRQLSCRKVASKTGTTSRRLP